MPYATSEIQNAVYSDAVSNPFSSFTGGWHDTSKVKTLAAHFFVNVNCGVGADSMACVLEAAFDALNPILVFSSGVAVVSGYITYQGSINNWPFPMARQRWISTAVSNYAGSAFMGMWGKG